MSRPSRKLPLLVGLVAGTFAAAHIIGHAQTGREQSPAPMPGRIAEMQHHYLQVTQIHEAVIRGDLGAVRRPAALLAAISTPAGVPARGAYFVENIRAASRRLATSSTLSDAAGETVQMLRQCSACHQSVGVYPQASRPGYPDVGGIVGHMLAHRRAMDSLLQGLLIPSITHWRDGAEQLRVPTLPEKQLLDDPGLTTAVRQAEVEVHALADRAAAASSPDERAATYGRLLTTCATCHSLHPKIWGPQTEVK